MRSDVRIVSGAPQEAAPMGRGFLFPAAGGNAVFSLCFMADMPTLDTPLSDLGPTAKRRAAELADMGLRTVRDMLFHFPSRHEDCRSGAPLAEAAPGMTVSVVAQVVKAKSR